jgi:hypothetical protein
MDFAKVGVAACGVSQIARGWGRPGGGAPWEMGPAFAAQES